MPRRAVADGGPDGSGAGADTAEGGSGGDAGGTAASLNGIDIRREYAHWNRTVRDRAGARHVLALLAERPLCRAVLRDRARMHLDGSSWHEARTLLRCCAMLRRCLALLTTRTVPIPR